MSFKASLSLGFVIRGLNSPHVMRIFENCRTRKKGILEAGGYPVEFPVFSNGESNLRPTAMFTRNLASMDVEEAIRGNPIDGVVLLTGCDKTTLHY